MTSLLLIRITCPSRRVAAEIAGAAFERRLAACANLEGPVTSTYRWKGVVEHAFEFVLWIKAPESRWNDIETLVGEIHPCDVPAIVALPCAHASAAYAAWVNDNTDT